MAWIMLGEGKEDGEVKVRVAVPMFNNRVSPRFDLAAKLLIANIADGKIIDRQEFSLVNLNSIRRTTLLCNMGVNILICGGISNFAQRLVRGSGIDIISMVQGEVDKKRDDLLANDAKKIIH